MAYPREVQFVRGAIRPDQYPVEHLPEIAFAGRSNVGKSSLINTLVGRRGLARTSQTPGKTQLVQFYRVDGRFSLVDLPGYGYARAPQKMRRRWGIAMERYLSERRTLRLVVLLLDMRRIPSRLDLELKSWLDQMAIPTCYALTKADKISRGKRSWQIHQVSQTLGIPSEHLIPFSARTREGRPALWGRILEAVRAHGG
jgi:GTP-binding protein